MSDDWNKNRYPGCVTVYDFDGNYLGFMGTNAWEASKKIGDKWTKVPALVEALRWYAEGDYPDDKKARDALAAWEQE